MGNCGKKCAKLLLIVFNILFWLSGLALIIIGAVYATKPDFTYFQDFLSPDDPLLVSAMYVLIGIGGFIFIFGFCGCCGAIKENRCLLGVYIILMVLVMIAELGIGIYVAVKKNEIESKGVAEVVSALQTRYPMYNATTNTGANFKKAVDAIQLIELQCCGVNGPTDWMYSMWYNSSLTAAEKAAGYATPRSCCNNTLAMTDNSVYATCQTGSGYYTTGCWTDIKQWISAHFPIVIGVGCGIAFLEILGLICAIVVCKAVDDDDDDEYV